MKPQQQSLFDLAPAAWELDDAGEQLVATVVFASGPHGALDYSVPDRLRGCLSAGQRVQVPLGKGDRRLTGYCVRLESRPAGRRLKPLEAVVDERALLSPAMLRLTEWMADYYLCGWGQVLEAVVPAGVRGRAGTRERQFASLPSRLAARL
jgi:primosomal protein N' (replication factor Y)